MENIADVGSAESELDSLLDLFRRHGGTDEAYLDHHYKRFFVTLDEFCSTWDRARGMRVLDVGAHWLHQAILWRRAGFDVTAVDLSVTLELENVKSVARGEGISLVTCDDLEGAASLTRFGDDRFDVILFAEIFEHLTFNPVDFWKEIHRLLVPGGRIVITTPNFYAWNGRAWNVLRFLSGFGGGITVDEVLGMNTHGHHWREYSRKEIIRYFCLLSPDFNVVKARTVRNYYPPHPDRKQRILGRFFERFPGLRPNLHIEVELSSKEAGIVASPGW